MHIIKAFFWIAVFVVFYNYAGYALIIFAFNSLKGIFSRKPFPREVFEPAVSIVIASFNEEAIIEQKIGNCLALEYPVDKLQIIFITDGSTDKSPEIIRRYARIRLMHQPVRAGKTAALNRAMQEVKTPVAIFCDANTLLNKESIRNMVRHYVNENVGGVAGEKKIIPGTVTKSAGAGEGLYWRYESKLKQLDSDFYSVAGAAGELFSIRTHLFDPVDPVVILDDFIISMKVAMKGYRIVYEPDAFAMEMPSASVKDESKRKVRISAGGYQAILLLKGLLNPFKYHKLSFLYVSHRFLRWAVSPYCLILIFVLGCYLAFTRNAGPIYEVLCLLQIAFYCLGFTGYLLSRKNITMKIFNIPFYFLFMNFSVVAGLGRFIRGKQSAAWEKASRETSQ